MPIKTVLFDINETVLDLRELYPLFGTYYADEGLTKRWFLSLLHSSTVAALTKVDTTFADLAKITLSKLAEEQGIDEADTAIQTIADKLMNLPAHSDVIEALKTLRRSGFKTAAFSNSSNNLVTNQIKNARLTDFFDAIISVENAKSFKPDPAVYHYAAEVLGQPKEELCLLAAHDWDTHGALSAGLNAAYLNRSGVSYHPAYKKPELTADTMTDLADKIIAEYGA